ncbi:hypothetical protein GOV10_03570 [Candidatus Woesearchaeota archaeon]|nr:hypothetical protein [Candidatus Woesearchaeota archaeon]
MDEIPTVIVETRADWRAWLRKHHRKESKVQLISYKRHTGRLFLTHRAQMEEAICFGWIDTTLKRIDEEKYARTFVRRTEKGSWSKNTLRYAEEMIAQNKIAKYGLEMYTAGKKKKPIDHDLPKNPGIPPELKKLLSRNKKARIFYESLAPSYKRMYNRWVHRAKLRETKEKRAKLVLERCKEGKKPMN